MSEPTKISVLVKAWTNMGDHAEYVTRAHEVKPGETVEGLAQRLLTHEAWMGLDQPKRLTPQPDNWIELRIIDASEPQP